MNKLNTVSVGIGLAVVVCLMLGSEALAGAKEKANRTKCAAKIDNIGSSGCDGVRRPATVLIPRILKLRDLGNDRAARRLTHNGVRQTRHRGHVTVLKLAATVDQCVAKMKRDGDSREDIAFIQILGKRWIASVRADVSHNVDSFFDIWI